MSAVHTSTASELDVQCTSNIRVSVSIRLQRRGSLVDLLHGHYIIASWLCILQQARVEFMHAHRALGFLQSVVTWMWRITNIVGGD